MRDMNSTIGRFYAASIRTVGPVIRGVAALSPSLAARVVVSLFATPLRNGSRPAPGQPALPAPTDWIDTPLGRLAIYGSGAGAPVLLLHGWNGSAHDMATLVDALARAGFRAITFDMPAHGRSKGRRLTLPRMATAARAVADRIGPLAGVVGHSLGAAAMVHALADGLDAAVAVAIAPPRRMGPFLRAFTRALGLGAAHDARVLARVERMVGVPIEAFDVDRAARTLDIPALVIHDIGDRQVPFADGVAIADAWPNASLVAVQGLGHRRPLHDASVARRVVGFLLDHAVAQMPGAPMSRQSIGGRRVGLVP